MSFFDELNRQKQVASYAKAEQENRVGRWIFWKIVTQLLLFPAKVTWRWKGQRTHGFLAHLIQFAFFTVLAYLIPVVVVIEIARSMFGGGVQ